MMAVSEPDTHTVTVMAATQVLKTELLLNVVFYFIHQDPMPILFIQPTQDAAAAFAKERFNPTVDVMPKLKALIQAPRAGTNENTLTHRDFPAGNIDFVGAHSPLDLASRPRPVIVSDEINKFPVSAGDEGDPLALAEERASTFADIGRAKFVRTCSPTVKGECRIGREYEASDQRKCFVACPHCDHEQILTWGHVRWEKVLADGTVTWDVEPHQVVREHRPATASIACEADGCGAIWTEEERKDVLRALEHAPDHGWRQTRPFLCCGETQNPEEWDEAGRSLCRHCGERSAYAGHAGFRASKLYSIRHRLSALVTEFRNARGSPELMKKFTNTGLAEQWEAVGGAGLDGSKFVDRAEPYGPDDLPNDVLTITGFCDVQGDRLEVQLIGWGADEEAWPFLYEVIREDPAQTAAWVELDALLARSFTRADGKILRIAAFGIDTGGNHTAQVYSYCRRRAKRRIFPCKGMSGNKPLWPTTASQSKLNEKLWMLGVDSGKEQIYARLRIAEPGPGYIHFPIDEAFGTEYFLMLTAERREVHKRAGQTYAKWVPIRDRNEALDTMVGALAVRRSLPRRIEDLLEYHPNRRPTGEAAPTVSLVDPVRDAPEPVVRPPRPPPPPRTGYLGNTPRNWLRR